MTAYLVGLGLSNGRNTTKVQRDMVTRQESQEILLLHRNPKYYQVLSRQYYQEGICSIQFTTRQ